MNNVDILKTCPIFSRIDSHDGLRGAKNGSLSELASLARVMKIKKGEMIFNEGDKAGALYVLVSGVVTLVKYSPSGKEQFIRIVKNGEMFAEAALFSGGDYPVSAIATESSELLSLKREHLLKFLEERPSVSLEIIGAMANLLLHLNNLLTELSLGTVETRLATYLLKKNRSFKNNIVVLDISKRELAFKLGTIPETLSRSFRKLEKKSIIKVKGKRIIINNVHMLEDLI